MLVRQVRLNQMITSTKKQNILIIGAGNIGRRHAESICCEKKIKNNYEVHIYDKNPKHYEELSAILSQREKHITPKFCFNENEIPSEIFLIIFATDSRNRFDSVRRFFETKNARFCILEKFLFPREQEYFEVSKILNKNNVKAFVNCVPRCLKIFKNLNDLLKDQTIKNISVEGNSWNLASNGVHFIDLWCFLTNESNFWLDSFNVKVQDSTRNNYKEIYGQICLSSNSGSISLINHNLQDDKLMITISTAGSHVEINYIDKHLIFKNKSSNLEEKVIFDIPFQSQLTAEYLNSIVSYGQLSLPDYQTSSVIHRNLLKAYEKIFIDNEIDLSDGVPVT